MVTDLPFTSAVTETPVLAARPRIVVLDNPATGSVRLRYSTPVKGRVVVEAYSVTGRVVARLDEGVREAGSHEIVWNRNGLNGTRLSSGLYWLTARVEIIGCEVTANTLDGIEGAGAYVIGCTIAGNRHAGIYAGGTIHLERSIIWGNCGEEGSDIHAWGARVYLTCCAWPDSGTFTEQGGRIYPIGRQVHSDPRLCGPLPCPQPGNPIPGGDYSIRSDSPCRAEFSPCQERGGASRPASGNEEVLSDRLLRPRSRRWVRGRL